MKKNHQYEKSPQFPPHAIDAINNTKKEEINTTIQVTLNPNPPGIAINFTK